MQKNFKSYKEYLESEQWEQIKEDYNEFSPYIDSCFFCHNTEGLIHHHWRYPKKYRNDSWKNLILTCRECHTCLHNIWPNKELHNSALFPDNSRENFIKYISWALKTMRVMEVKHYELIREEF